MEEKFYQQTTAEVFSRFQTGEQGISDSDARKRIFEAEKVQIKPPKKQTFISKFMGQIKDLMVLVLLVSGIFSVVIGAIENSTSEIVDGAIILGIVVMNALFGVYQERKSEKAIDSLKNLTQPETEVLREGKVKKIKNSELVHGDVVVLTAGSIVPADLRIFDAQSLKMNESSLTGESEAVEKDVSILSRDVPIADRHNMAYCGSVVESGHGKGVVVAIGTETQIGKIAKSLVETKKEMTPLQKNIQDVGKVLTYLILLMAGITFILETIANPTNILEAFLTAVAISVAAIPESMPAVITIIMSLGVSKLAKRRVIVKRLHAVETLGACDVVCSDKTGTITQNQMKVQETFSLFESDSLFQEMFFNCLVLCNDAELGENGYVGGATEVALVEFAKGHGMEKSEVEKNFPRIKEQPFSSQNKFMLTQNLVSGDKVSFAKGAIDRILPLCQYVALGGEVVALEEKTRKKILSQNKKMCEKGLRVIASAFKKGEMSDSEYVFLGLCALQDPPRIEVCEAVQKCKKAGMRPVMITGDHKDTALAIAKQVGIAKSEKDVLSGEEIDMFSDEEFVKIVEKKSVFARVSPQHKVRIVEALKKDGHIVAMTGDGVNDAPGLKKADIGIGMGKTGTDVTKDVADIIVADDNFASIIVAVEEGRKIYSNIQKTIKYLFSANMAEILSLFILTIAFPGKTFLLPVQILFVNLITDSLPAIALGTEVAESDIMQQSPRKRSDSLFSDGMGTSLFVLGVVQTALVLGAYLFGLFTQGESVAITMAFYTLNLIQLLYMFTARTRESCFKSNPFKNKFFTLSLVVGFGLLALMVFTDFGTILKLSTLNLSSWAVVLILSFSIIPIGEFFKFIERKHPKKKTGAKFKNVSFSIFKSCIQIVEIDGSFSIFYRRCLFKVKSMADGF